ncbi:hypothetical protein ACF3NR_02290 [Vaginella massiliensis]|uniref:hypothetical protein n=1 Tax=Vaginella massiliensis TaxID=1816680 RepID=UPI00375137D0
MEELTEDILMATFTGMGRTNEQLIYFDKESIDVLINVNGYLSSILGDQSEMNKLLMNKIINGEPYEYIDENRFILIDRLLLRDFLSEYKNQSKGKEPFYSFPELFCEKVLKEYNKTITINDLTFSNNIQQKFHEVFGFYYQSRVKELKDEYTNIFESTCNIISKNWINNKILNKKNMKENELCNKIVQTLKIQIENEFDTKVFECGFYSKSDSNFKQLQPMGAIPPDNAEHIFYFLVPIDDADNIIFNNYYELFQATQSGLMFTPSNRRAVHEFQANLREDIELVNFISNAIENYVYPIGAKKVLSYKPTDNIVKNAEKIEDLKYRFFRFYLPKLT